MTVRNGLLAIVSRGTQHGFAIKKAFEDETGQLWKINVGQVYTTLTRLVRDGLIDELPDDPNEDPAHRRFQITALGQDELDTWYATPRPPGLPERDGLVIKITTAMTATSEPNTPIDPFAIIASQRRAATSALQAVTRQKASTEETNIQRLISLDAVATHIEAEIRWLDLCRARLSSRITGKSQQERQSNSPKPQRRKGSP